MYKAKSRKYQGIIQGEKSSKTWQVRVIWYQQLENKQVSKRGTEPGVRKGKCSLLACHTRCKCSMETTHNSVKFKLGIMVMKLVESLISWEVTAGQGSECHLTFVREIPVSTIKLPKWLHFMCISSVPQGIPVWLDYWKVA